MSAIESVPTIAGKPAENKKGIMMVDITVKNILEATGGVLISVSIQKKLRKETCLFQSSVQEQTDTGL